MGVCKGQHCDHGCGGGDTDVVLCGHAVGDYVGRWCPEGRDACVQNNCCGYDYQQCIYNVLARAGVCHRQCTGPDGIDGVCRIACENEKLMGLDSCLDSHCYDPMNLWQ